MFRILNNSKRIYGICRIHGEYRKLVKQNSSSKPSVTYTDRIFSGIQPTGNMHLGNYVGAVRRWIELQNSGKNVIWSIVDLHSITLPQDPIQLRQNILKMTATLLACGIDPDKSILFQQSTISMHAELSWILGCNATMPRLGQLPQFKEKCERVKDIPLGLYIYPILQAADILLYKATHVPVGQDQVQHLQLAQHLARTFNRNFNETFPIPRALVNEDNSSRLKSLRDPMQKMSKSSADPKSRLELTDEPRVLLNKIKKAVTDFTSAVTYEPETRPGVSNLITIHSLLSGKSTEEICKEAENIDSGEYKFVVADVVIDKLTPIRERINELIQEPQYLEKILRDGAERATAIAVDTWLEVRNKIGIGNNALVSNILELQRAASRRKR